MGETRGTRRCLETEYSWMILGVRKRPSPWTMNRCVLKRRGCHFPKRVQSFDKCGATCIRSRWGKVVPKYAPSRKSPHAYKRRECQLLNPNTIYGKQDKRTKIIPAFCKPRQILDSSQLVALVAAARIDSD